MSEQVNPIVVSVYPNPEQPDTTPVPIDPQNPYYRLGGVAYPPIVEADPLVVIMHEVAPYPADQSPLARPEIVDALEAVDQLTHPPRERALAKTLSVPDLPIDFELARTGLRVLKQELDTDGKDLRQAVAETTKNLLVLVTDEKPRRAISHDRPAVNLATQEAAREDHAREQQAIETKREARRLAREQEHARQAAYRQELATALAGFEAEAPAGSVATVLALAEGLVLHGEENKLVGQPAPNFQEKITRQVEKFLFATTRNGENYEISSTRKRSWLITARTDCLSCLYKRHRGGCSDSSRSKTIHHARIYS